MAFVPFRQDALVYIVQLISDITRTAGWAWWISAWLLETSLACFGGWRRVHNNTAGTSKETWMPAQNMQQQVWIVTTRNLALGNFSTAQCSLPGSSLNSKPPTDSKCIGYNSSYKLNSLNSQMSLMEIAFRICAIFRLSLEDIQENSLMISFFHLSSSLWTWTMSGPSLFRSPWKSIYLTPQRIGHNKREPLAKTPFVSEFWRCRVVKSTSRVFVIFNQSSQSYLEPKSETHAFKRTAFCWKWKKCKTDFL